MAQNTTTLSVRIQENLKKEIQNLAKEEKCNMDDLLSSMVQSFRLSQVRELDTNFGSNIDEFNLHLKSLSELFSLNLEKQYFTKKHEELEKNRHQKELEAKELEIRQYQAKEYSLIEEQSVRNSELESLQKLICNYERLVESHLQTIEDKHKQISLLEAANKELQNRNNQLQSQLATSGETIRQYRNQNTLGQIAWD